MRSASLLVTLLVPRSLQSSHKEVLSSLREGRGKGTKRTIFTPPYCLYSAILGGMTSYTQPPVITPSHHKMQRKKRKKEKRRKEVDTTSIAPSNKHLYLQNYHLFQRKG